MHGSLRICIIKHLLQPDMHQLCLGSVAVHMLICAIDLAGTDSRSNAGLPEVDVTGVTVSESGAPAANPATTPNSIPAVAHAAQGPAPVPITRADSPLPTPEEGPTPPLTASGPAPVFGFGATGADRHAGPPASDEAPEAQDAGMLLSQVCVFCRGHVACLHHGTAEHCMLHRDPGKENMHQVFLKEACLGCASYLSSVMTAW